MLVLVFLFFWCAGVRREARGGSGWRRVIIRRSGGRTGAQRRPSGGLDFHFRLLFEGCVPGTVRLDVYFHFFIFIFEPGEVYSKNINKNRNQEPEAAAKITFELSALKPH